MEKWEYQIVKTGYGGLPMPEYMGRHVEVEGYINQLGGEGWELVGLRRRRRTDVVL